MTASADTTSPETVVVTATDPTSFAASGSGSVTVVSQAFILGVSIQPSTISTAAGAKGAFGVVYLNSPAPTGGFDGST